MADYGVMPEDADERFSLRQMTLLLEARSRRKRAESKINANEIWQMAFGESEGNEQNPRMIPIQNNFPKTMSFFGIKSPKERR